MCLQAQATLSELNGGEMDLWIEIQIPLISVGTFIDFKRGRVWYAAESGGPPKRLQVMCSEHACVHLRCRAAVRCPPRIYGARGNLQGGGKEPRFCCRHGAVFVALGFGERSSLSLAWFLVPGQSKGGLALSLQCQSSHPLLPAVWLLSQSWSPLLPLTPVL